MKNLLELKDRCEELKQKKSILIGKLQELDNVKLNLKKDMKKFGVNKLSDLQNKLKKIEEEYDFLISKLEKQVGKIKDDFI